MKASVLVATRDRAESLRRLLESLRSLEYCCVNSVEVLIVDNGSTDGTAQVLDWARGGSSPFLFRVIQERQPGKSRALNLAMRYANGEIVLVIDDDVVVHPQWLKKHLDCYRETSFDAVQGRVLPGVDPDGRPADPKRLREYNIPIVDYGEEIRAIRGLTGTNMSFKREVQKKIGFFDPRLGPGASGFSEDTEYSLRIRKAGFQIGYAPDAIVYHELSPARYGRAYNRRVQYRKGLSRSLYRRDSLLLNVIPNLLAHCLRFALYTVLARRQDAYRTEGRILKCCGHLAGTGRHVFHRRENRS